MQHRYSARVAWERGDAAFVDNRYSRGHRWEFDGGAVVPASASPQVVPAPMSVPAGVDPEEALVASASSCHMLFFLSLAAKQGFRIDRYVDDAYGVMERDARGRTSITRIVLRPEMHFAGDRVPTAAEIASLHHEAHEQCYVANTLRAAISIEAPR